MITDQIADFLSRIRNATKAQHRFVDADWSKMRENIAKILKEYGFIESYLVKKDTDSRGKIRIYLKYGSARVSVIQGIKRMSTPGCRQLYMLRRHTPLLRWIRIIDYINITRCDCRKRS